MYRDRCLEEEPVQVTLFVHINAIKLTMKLPMGNGRLEQGEQGAERQAERQAEPGAERGARRGGQRRERESEDAGRGSEDSRSSGRSEEADHQHPILPPKPTAGHQQLMLPTYPIHRTDDFRRRSVPARPVVSQFDYLGNRRLPHQLESGFMVNQPLRNLAKTEKMCVIGLDR